MTTGARFGIVFLPESLREFGALVAVASVTGSALARRLGWSIGPLKYLNLSFTYGTKGYPKGAIETRERQVGVEIGLNFQEILDDVGVRRDRWWGYVAHMILDNIRFPFTAGGFRYDLNHKKWHGLDSGNSFGF